MPVFCSSQPHRPLWATRITLRSIAGYAIIFSRMRDIPGYYGKSPARGDFLSRRMPPRFAGVWDQWLRNVVAESKAILGTDWLAAWLDAPVWHFAFGGVAEEAPGFGVFIPSVDRVGRNFPFTVLGLCRDGGAEPEVWDARAEALALSALEDDFDPDRLEGELEALGPPGRPSCLMEPSPYGWSLGFGAENCQTPSEGETLWRCRETARMPAATLRTQGLPIVADAACLVAGVSIRLRG